MTTYYFNGTSTSLHLADDKIVNLTERGQTVELTKEQAAKHVPLAPLLTEDEWKAFNRKALKADPATEVPAPAAAPVLVIPPAAPEKKEK
jgi:hypothetical protein